MIKTLIVGRRAAGISRQACHEHLRDVHGPMVVCAPPDAGRLPEDYVQSHVFDGAYPAAGSHALERDLATLIWAESVAAAREATSTPYYLANMRPDEPRFVDDATVARMRLEPDARVEGPRDGFKLFVLVSRAAGAEEAAWANGRAAARDAVGRAPGVIALVENMVAEPATGTRFVDVVLEAWVASRDEAAGLVRKSDACLAPFGHAIDRQRSFLLAAEIFSRERLRALHRPHPA